jgi:GxxExxY protein
MSLKAKELTHGIVGAAIEVHKKLGPGLLESAYQKCLCRELFLRGISFRDEYPLPLEYKGLRLSCGYRVDIVVDNLVAVEVKSVQVLAPIHDAQLLTYMRVGNWPLGLLINFNVEVLRHGIHRRIMGYDL